MDSIWVELALAIGISLVIALGLLGMIWVSVSIARRRVPWLNAAFIDLRARMQLFIIAISMFMAVLLLQRTDSVWWNAAVSLLLIFMILTAGFFLQQIVNVAISKYVKKFEAADQNDAETRRITTQLRLVRRLLKALIALFTVGLALFTFPEVQAIGAGILASAGVISIIGGLAAQAVLGNLLAGVQLAFSNAIRVGDVVVVEGEWGTIGEITLSYVVVYIWDERRLIVPSTYFTQRPFETWTRKSPKIYGIVTMDLDWSIPVEAVRKEFQHYLESNSLWDRRVSSCQLTDSTGGFVRVRFVASARDSNEQWNLRCQIREHMVAWVRENFPSALPRTRVEISESEK